MIVDVEDYGRRYAAYLCGAAIGQTWNNPETSLSTEMVDVVKTIVTFGLQARTALENNKKEEADKVRGQFLLIAHAAAHLLRYNTMDMLWSIGYNAWRQLAA